MNPIKWLAGVIRPAQVGAAWQKTAKDTDRDYLSVKLDDPSFPAPIYATLIEVEGQEGLQLIWSRPAGTEDPTAPGPAQKAGPFSCPC